MVKALEKVKKLRRVSVHEQVNNCHQQIELSAFSVHERALLSKS